MVLEEKKVRNICNFYVSEYHLEIMLLPYISKKIDNEEQVFIITEKDLEETLKIVIEKTNLDKNKKEKIINLKWNLQEIKNIMENSNIILVGNRKFITEKLKEITKKELKYIEIVACYDYNEVKEYMQEIIPQYDKTLNSLGVIKL